MKDLERRIEAAAKAIRYEMFCPQIFDGCEQCHCRETARAAFRAAFPELFTDPPTHWLAPMEYSERMSQAGYEALMEHYQGQKIGVVRLPVQQGMAEISYNAMRDAYLAKEPEPTP